ncbi:MAG: spermidine/putrescine ABC transporter substrate-binding protein [Anaerolineae bacterium]|nr:spermidine/putrescine ABC transporter substrate-binding protein [Anaerolineae bacterium]
MRKVMWLAVILAVLVGLPVAAQEATEAVQEPWTCPDGFQGQTLSIYNWSTYVAEDTIANFEAACGVTVEYSIYGSNEEMVAIMRQGNPGYDLVVPTDYMVALMIAEGLLSPLNRELIPNFANLDPTLIDKGFDPGNVYSIPYQWGTVGFGYNVEKVGELSTWAESFAYAGPVAWLEDARAMFGVALSILGYDPNSSNPDEITEARDFLLANGANVVAIAADDGQALLASGEADIVVEYSGDIFQIMAENPDKFNYVIPAEAALFWLDNMVIPTGAPNPDLAAVFMDYILDPQVGADISNYTAFASPNMASIELGLIDPELLANPGIYPTEETRQNLFIIEDNPEGEQLINDAWNELKIFLG